MKQHIRRKCKHKLFEAIAGGDRCFDICRGDLDVDIDDFFTFVEIDAEGSPTGREIYRRISYVVNTRDLNAPEDEVVKYGFTITGIVAPEFKRLQSVLADNCFILAFGLHHEGEDNEVLELATVPPLTVPTGLSIEQVLEAINVPVWPAGVYSITLLMQPTAEGSPHTNIVDHLIMVKEQVADEKVVFTELDIRHLHNTRLIDMDGRQVVPTFSEPEEDSGLLMDDENGQENREHDPTALDPVIEDPAGQ